MNVAKGELLARLPTAWQRLATLEVTARHAAAVTPAAVADVLRDGDTVTLVLASAGGAGAAAAAACSHSRPFMG